MSYKNKILIIGPAWVGDMMMADALFQLLRQQNPGCEIQVLAPKWSEGLLARMPSVQKSMVLPLGHGELQLRKRFQFAKQLRAEKYDQAIVLPNSFKSALIPFWAAIPVRTGWLGEYRFGLLNDARKLNKKNFPKMIERFAALAFAKDEKSPRFADAHRPPFSKGVIPCPKLIAHSENITVALHKYNLKTDKPILALCPGAEFGPSKCWPANYFADVANQKIRDGWAVWIFGSEKDRLIGEEIQTLTNQGCENLAGKTVLSDAVDLLSLAQCVVTNDSGLMHIAAALNCKVIAIYGSTSPEFTPPLSDRAIILKLNLDCQPCFQRKCPLKHHDCMQLLRPEMVLSNFCEFLA